MKTYPTSAHWFCSNYKEFVAIWSLQFERPWSVTEIWTPSYYERLKYFVKSKNELFEVVRNFRTYINVNIFKMLVNIWSSKAEMNMTKMLTTFAKYVNTLAPQSVLLSSLAILISFAKRLIKQHIMKKYGKWNLKIKWRQVISFKPRPIYHWVTSPRYPLGRKLSGPKNGCGRCGGNKKSHSLALQPVAVYCADWFL
jgi:hypothetical protein